MFSIGQVVVCVDDQNWIDGANKFRQGCRFPVAKGVYVVRHVTLNSGVPGVRLAEIVNPPLPFVNGEAGEISFLARRFRPAVKTDISILIEILNKTPHDKRVDA